jgi:hypothetical protein
MSQYTWTGALAPAPSRSIQYSPLGAPGSAARIVLQDRPETVGFDPIAVHERPSPKYPGLQAHEKPPGELVQVASA